MSARTRAVAYLALPFGGYPDTASDYVKCATRSDVERELADYGWMDNPGISVYVLTKGEDPDAVIKELSENSDPYPDFQVERGPRGGIQWTRA